MARIVSAKDYLEFQKKRARQIQKGIIKPKTPMPTLKVGSWVKGTAEIPFKPPVKKPKPSPVEPEGQTFTINNIRVSKAVYNKIVRKTGGQDSGGQYYINPNPVSEKTGLPTGLAKPVSEQRFKQFVVFQEGRARTQARERRLQAEREKTIFQKASERIEPDRKRLAKSPLWLHKTGAVMVGVAQQGLGTADSVQRFFRWDKKRDKLLTNYLKTSSEKDKKLYESHIQPAQNIVNFGTDSVKFITSFASAKTKNQEERVKNLKANYDRKYGVADATKSAWSNIKTTVKKDPTKAIAYATYFIISTAILNKLISKPVVKLKGIKTRSIVAGKLRYNSKTRTGKFFFDLKTTYLNGKSSINRVKCTFRFTDQGVDIVHVSGAGITRSTVAGLVGRNKQIRTLAKIGFEATTRKGKRLSVSISKAQLTKLGKQIVKRRKLGVLKNNLFGDILPKNKIASIKTYIKGKKVYLYQKYLTKAEKSKVISRLHQIGFKHKWLASKDEYEIFRELLATGIKDKHLKALKFRPALIKSNTYGISTSKAMKLWKRFYGKNVYVFKGKGVKFKPTKTFLIKNRAYVYYGKLPEAVRFKLETAFKKVGFKVKFLTDSKQADKLRRLIAKYRRAKTPLKNIKIKNIDKTIKGFVRVSRVHGERITLKLRKKLIKDINSYLKRAGVSKTTRQKIISAFKRGYISSKQKKQILSILKNKRIEKGTQIRTYLNKLPSGKLTKMKKVIRKAKPKTKSIIKPKAKRIIKVKRMKAKPVKQKIRKGKIKSVGRPRQYKKPRPQLQIAKRGVPFMSLAESKLLTNYVGTTVNLVQNFEGSTVGQLNKLGGLVDTITTGGITSGAYSTRMLGIINSLPRTKQGFLLKKKLLTLNKKATKLIDKQALLTRLKTKTKTRTRARTKVRLATKQAHALKTKTRLRVKTALQQKVKTRQRLKTKTKTRTRARTKTQTQMQTKISSFPKFAIPIILPELPKFQKQKLMKGQKIMIAKRLYRYVPSLRGIKLFYKGRTITRKEADRIIKRGLTGLEVRLVTRKRKRMKRARVVKRKRKSVTPRAILLKRLEKARAVRMRKLKRRRR